MEEKKRKKTTVELPIEPFGSHPDAPASRTSLIAKKDFEIHHNGYQRKIKVGDDLSDVPEVYLANLRTEGVL